MNTNIDINYADAIILIIVFVLCIFCIRFIVGFFRDPGKKH